MAVTAGADAFAIKHFAPLIHLGLVFSDKQALPVGIEQALFLGLVAEDQLCAGHASRDATVADP